MNYTEPVIALVLFGFHLFWLNIFMPTPVNQNRENI